MKTIGVSEHVKGRLDAIKGRNGHTSYDSVIRSLLQEFGWFDKEKGELFIPFRFDLKSTFQARGEAFRIVRRESCLDGYLYHLEKVAEETKS